MSETAGIAGPSAILAVTYTDGILADRFLADLGYSFRDAGLAVAGLVQRNQFVRNRAKCDMEIEELASGVVLQLSEYRGEAAKGCRLDRAALADALVLIRSALADKPALLILNKFGKVEAEGGGLREVIAEAVQLNVPIVVGVPLRNLDQWRIFTGELAEECAMERACVEQWLSVRRVLAISGTREHVESHTQLGPRLSSDF